VQEVVETLPAMDPLLVLVCDGWALLQSKAQEPMGLLLVWETLLLSHLALNWLDYSMGHSVVWLGVIVAQAVVSPMGPMQRHVLVVEKGSLDSHLEGLACDSASLH